MKVGIDLGTGAGGAPASVDLEELLATRLLVQGNSGSGKSHLLRRLLEQSAPWVQQCVIDPEGDFVTLADRFGHVVVDAARTETELTRIAGRIRQHRVSVVLNLEGLDIAEEQLSELFRIDPRALELETHDIEQFFDTFGHRLPSELYRQLDLQRARLGAE